MYSLLLLGCFMAALPGGKAAIYTKKSPVLQVTGRSFDTLIAKSNHTSIVEFYAPWCGHCQSLKPAYEKAAKSLEGLAKVAAIDCDDASNKAFCGTMEVRGFPTLKIVRPNKKPGGQPAIEDYQGARTAKAIFDAVSERINNYVKRVTDKDLDSFLAQPNSKAILFSDKAATSVLLQSIAIDFLGVISFAQVQKKEAESLKKYKIDQFPTLVLIPRGSDDAVLYKGDMKKQGIVHFLSQAGVPNPDYSGKIDEIKTGAAPKSAPLTADSDTAFLKLQEDLKSQGMAESFLSYPANEPGSLATECFADKPHTCIVHFTREKAANEEGSAVETLQRVAEKQAQAKRNTFKFVVIPATNSDASVLLRSLALPSEAEVIAINLRRGWWRLYTGNFEGHSFETWTESIRLGDGTKESLPNEVKERLTAKQSDSSTPESVLRGEQGDTLQETRSESEESSQSPQDAHIEL